MELETINLFKWLLEDEDNECISNISYDSGKGGYFILGVEVKKTYGYDESEVYTYLIDSKTGNPKDLNYNGEIISWQAENICYERLLDENKPTEYSFFFLSYSYSYEELQNEDVLRPVGGIIGKNAETYYVFPEISVKSDFSIDKNIIKNRYLTICESASEEYLSMLEEYRWEKGTYEYEMISKKRYGLFDLFQRKIVIQPAFDKLFVENGQIYTVLCNGIFTDKEKYVPSIQKGAGLIMSSIHSEEMYNCYQCPIIINGNDEEDIRHYIFRVGEYAGFTLSEVHERFPKALLDMVKNSILHVEFYQEEDVDTDDIDDIVLLLSSWSDCHLTYKDVEKVDDTMRMSNGDILPYSSFRFDGWKIEDIIANDYTYLLRLVKYRKLYIASEVLSELYSKYSSNSHMSSRIKKIEDEMIGFESELRYADDCAMAQYEEDLNNSLFNEDFWNREAFDGNPDAYWNID